MTNKQLSMWRHDTPHLSPCQLAHFNNAGASLMPVSAIAGVEQYHTLEQQIGGYEAAAKMAEQLESFYINAARLIGAEPVEIAYKESATDAGQAILLSLRLKAGDRIIVHGTEYASNLLALTWLKERIGIHIDVVGSTDQGVVDLDDLRKAITPRTRVVCLTHIPTFVGIVQPADAVGEIAKEFGLFYLLDACQSLGQRSIDVKKIGCDALIGTGRKYLRGPRGTGFLYIRQTRLADLTPLTDLRGGSLHEDKIHYADGARRFERFEFNRAGQYGLSLAIAYALSVGLDTIQSRIETIAQALRDQLQEVAGVQIYEQGKPQSGIVTFTGTLEPNAALLELRAKSINVSITQPPKGSARLRASLHYFNDNEDIARLVGAIKQLSVA